MLEIMNKEPIAWGGRRWRTDPADGEEARDTGTVVWAWTVSRLVPSASHGVDQFKDVEHVKGSDEQSTGTCMTSSGQSDPALSSNSDGQPNTKDITRKAISDKLPVGN